MRPGREPALDRLCRWLAIAGGLLLSAAALVTAASVAGRYFLNSPIRGDGEISAPLTAAAVSLFLPYCQLRRGHVLVDVFTERAAPRLKGWLDALGALLLALVAGVIAWRLTLGALDLQRYNDESMVLRLPTWWGFVVAVPCFALLALVAVATARRALQEASRP